MSAREGGRKPDQLRAITFEPDYLENPHGSVVITQGRTKVLCTAMVDEDIPRWLRGQGKGWITAEYSLLPASTGERVQREAVARQAAGTDGRDPAADRPRDPRGRRLRGARRADAVARLRRPPGRRRHALRGDLRRVRRGDARARPLRPLDARSATRSRPSRSASSTARRCSTSTTPRTRAPTPT